MLYWFYLVLTLLPGYFYNEKIITITTQINENLKVTIFDIYGMLIKSGEIFGHGDHNINMSAYSSLQHGTYIIRISSDKTNITKKIIL